MQTFSVSRYKGISGTIEVSTDGGSVIVQGKNAAGKSSFIDGVVELFDPRGIRLTPHPIHHGEDEAKAEFIDTNLNVRITREWKRDKNGDPKSTLTVHALDGARHAKPSEIIAKLTGGIIFDPSRFLMLDPKPQRDMLLQKVELPFDLEQLEGRERAAEDERLKRGQAARAAEGAVTNADRPVPGTPLERVSTAELVAKLEAARQHNADGQRVVDISEDLGRQYSSLIERAAALRAELAKVEADAAEVMQRRGAANKAVEAFTPIDTTELEEQVRNVDDINYNVQLGENVRVLEERASLARKEWETANALVAKIQQEKADGLKQAVFPHPSLSVSDDGVLFDGVPFAQVNTGQREEAAFAIATAGQPDLRLVVVKNGDLMDESSLKRIDEIALERGYTVLIERGRPDTGGLVATFVEMVDGQSV